MNALVTELQRIDILADLDATRIAGYVRGEVRTLAEGELLFRQGDEPDSFYLFLSGRVELFRQRKTERVVIGSFGPGESGGEVPLLAGGRHLASAVATQPTRVLALSADLFWVLFSAFPDVRRRVLTNMQGRLAEVRRADQEAALRPLLRDLRRLQTLTQQLLGELLPAPAGPALAQHPFGPAPDPLPEPDDRLPAWLAERGVPLTQLSKMARQLHQAGLSVPQLAAVTEGIPIPQTAQVLRWLALAVTLDCRAHQLEATALPAFPLTVS
ncbi:cyclic nucleotide-binding domain-containing protein [Hymenobacter sp.]|uniref:cyclic nucleotide-binding domain-containing protein n=1 Tax=Hymenobacter sp. TaxID=1898978 RepID=UPI00286AE70F|nr:cyclic nucleotide-binding domain-containing protein [Hymenobacter sp.]